MFVLTIIRRSVPHQSKANFIAKKRMVKDISDSSVGNFSF